jgi:hypothetical protein
VGLRWRQQRTREMREILHGAIQGGARRQRRDLQLELAWGVQPTAGSDRPSDPIGSRCRAVHVWTCGPAALRCSETNEGRCGARASAQGRVTREWRTFSLRTRDGRQRTGATGDRTHPVRSGQSGQHVTFLISVRRSSRSTRYARSVLASSSRQSRCIQDAQGTGADRPTQWSEG